MIEHIKQVIQQTVHCLLNINNENNTGSPILAPRRWGQDALIAALKKARLGIESMKDTYSNDAALVAQIDVILLSIDQPLALFEENPPSPPSPIQGLP